MLGGYVLPVQAGGVEGITGTGWVGEDSMKKTAGVCGAWMRWRGRGRDGGRRGSSIGVSRVKNKKSLVGLGG